MSTNSVAAALAGDPRAITPSRQLVFRDSRQWSGFLAFATIALGLQSAQAAVTEAWVQRYSNIASNAADQAFKVVHDPAGDIIVTGTTSGFSSADRVTIKYSGADGSVLWQKRSSGNARGLAVDGSGNVVLTRGYSYGGNYTAKYAASDGALLWEKPYGGSNDGDQAAALARWPWTAAAALW